MQVRNQSKLPGMLLVHSNQCGHCIRFMPVYEEIGHILEDNNEGTIQKLESVQLDALPERNQKELDIRAFPTLFFFDGEGYVRYRYDPEAKRDKESILKTYRSAFFTNHA